jgi:3-methyl-2-oxobutanoate hydroxymethyltransferase
MIAERNNVDLILVGDSGTMVELFYESTIPATIDQMLNFTQAVRRGAKNTHIVGDFSFGTYEISNEQAIKTAIKFIRAGANSVKMEGGKTICDRIKAISDIGIHCCFHEGITPQLAESYRAQGKTIESFDRLVKSCLELEKAGASFGLLEGIPNEVGKQISKLLKIPVLGIGAGWETDGNLSIFSDILGLFPKFRPNFAKNFVPEIIQEYTKEIYSYNKQFGKENPDKDGLFRIAELALNKYVKDVKSGKFPNEEYNYKLKEEELNNLRQSKYWKKENE